MYCRRPHAHPPECVVGVCCMPAYSNPKLRIGSALLVKFIMQELHC
jgi:hypothetical protein